MSAMPSASAVSQIYGGRTDYVEKSNQLAYEIREKERGIIMTKDTMAAEIVGLSITGILSIAGLCVSLAINYTLLSLLFVMPLVGVAIGTGYLLYMKKHS